MMDFILLLMYIYTWRWAPRTDASAVNNHGDRFRPLSGSVRGTPSKWPNKWLINGFDANHLLWMVRLVVYPFFTGVFPYILGG